MVPPQTLRVPPFPPGGQDATRPPAPTPTRVRPMRIRAAVLERFGEPLNVTEVELAEPRAGEVLVRLSACGVCHTDMYTASGADPSGYAPTVLGHEGAGVVEVVGCRLQGAERIVCVDMSEDRLAMARAHGATETWTGGEEVVDRVLAETGG